MGILEESKQYEGLVNNFESKKGEISHWVASRSEEEYLYFNVNNLTSWMKRKIISYMIKRNWHVNLSS